MYSKSGDAVLEAWCLLGILTDGDKQRNPKEMLSGGEINIP